MKSSSSYLQSLDQELEEFYLKEIKFPFHSNPWSPRKGSKYPSFKILEWLLAALPTYLCLFLKTTIINRMALNHWYSKTTNTHYLRRNSLIINYSVQNMQKNIYETQKYREMTTKAIKYIHVPPHTHNLFIKRWVYMAWIVYLEIEISHNFLLITMGFSWNI